MKTIRTYHLRMIRNYIKIASEILENLPKITDGPIGMGVKVGKIADVVLEHFFEKNNEPHEMLENMGLTSTTNKAFVNMLFGTHLKNEFEIEARKVDVWSDIYVVRSKNATLYFVSTNDGKNISSKFWHSKDMSFNTIVERVWSIFDGRVHVELKHGNFEFSRVFENTDPMFGIQAAQMFSDFQKQHHAYVADHVPRTYLLCGPPGVGKTAFAERLSQINNRTIRLAAATMTMVDFKTISFLIDNMMPDFLIIDDIDRNLDNDKSLSTLFMIFEAFKRKHPDVTVILTVNDIHKLDAALLRPGRIDEIIDFECPDDRDRALIIAGYMEQFGIDASRNINDIVEASKGLSPAYLREIALQLKYKSPDKIVKIIKKMVSISSESEEDEYDSQEAFDAAQYEKSCDDSNVCLSCEEEDE